jgi:hypothetical protein
MQNEIIVIDDPGGNQDRDKANLPYTCSAVRPLVECIGQYKCANAEYDYCDQLIRDVGHLFSPPL